MAHRFSSRNFRDTVTVHPATYPADGDGAPARTDGQGVALACRVEYVNPKNATRGIDGPVPFGETAATILFQGRPAVAIAKETRIEHTSGGGGAISPPDVYTANGGLNDRGLGLFGVTCRRLA